VGHCQPILISSSFLGESVHATINGSVTLGSPRYWGTSIDESGPVVQFFTIGIDPATLLANQRPDLVRSTKAETADDGWAVDFFTVGVTTSATAVPSRRPWALMAGGLAWRYPAKETGLTPLPLLRSDLLLQAARHPRRRRSVCYALAVRRALPSVMQYRHRVGGLLSSLFPNGVKWLLMCQHRRLPAGFLRAGLVRRRSLLPIPLVPAYV